MTRSQDDGIDAHYVRGGTLVFARSELQATRLREAVEASRELGDGPDDFGGSPPKRRANAASSRDSFGATYTPHCARIHPARLVRGLADVVERLGGQIFENTKVTRILGARRGRPAEVVTEAASVHAPSWFERPKALRPRCRASDGASRRSTRS